MSMPLPPAWASNTNYSAGPDTGTPTKVDPASQANGFVRGVNAAAQHVNYVLDPITREARRAFLLAACKLRRIVLEGTAITDTAESMAAVQRSQDGPLLAIKTAQAFGLGEAADRFNVQGVPASITSLITDAARLTSGANSGRIVAIGTGGNRATRSDDDGVTWAASNDVGAVPAYIIASSTGGSFRTAPGVPSGGFEVVRTGIGSGAWTSLATTIASGSTLAGLAATATTEFACYDVAGDPSFQIEGGGAYTATGGTVANPTLFDEGGCLVGNGGTTIYHAGRLSTGTSIQVSSSTDGATWTTLTSIIPISGTSFTARPRLFMCQNTGLLVLAAPHNSAVALYASTNGTDWVGPLLAFPTLGVNAFAIAGGRLLMTHDDMLFASDGIGF